MNAPDEYPAARPYQDRHGNTHWRIRRGKKTIHLPKWPGHPEFEAAYQAAITGQPIKRAQVVRLPNVSAPRTFNAAWRVLKSDVPEWKALGPAIKTAQTRIIEKFLQTPVVKGEPLTFGEVEVSFLRRKHLKSIIADRSDTPHAAAHLLRCIRKLIDVALDQEWIETDPAHRLKYRPEYGGWKAWSNAALLAFATHWPIGTTPRLAFALALCFGHRRADITRVKWADLEAGGGNVVQHKTGRALWIPMLPELQANIEATPRVGEFVLLTKWGKPFTPAGLGMRMQHWTDAAGLASGHTLHGLRKSLGKALAEHDATTRQLMEVLGHTDIKHAELYSREAEQRRLAEQGMAKLAGAFDFLPRRTGGEPSGEP